MDAARIDVQAVSATPIARPWMERAARRPLHRRSEHRRGRLLPAAPDRLVPVMTVALHLPDLAVRQLRTAVEDLERSACRSRQPPPRGSSSTTLRSPSSGRRPWRSTCRYSFILWGCSLGGAPRRGVHVQPRRQPDRDVGRAVAPHLRRSAGPVPELRVWAAHAGGWLPSYSGRADHAWHQREDARTCEHPPSWYLRRMWFDALVYTAPALRFLVDSVGEDHVTLGSDYPFDMGVDDPIDRIEAALNDRRHEPPSRPRALRRSSDRG